ncbi:MAG: segregation/condensation protein A [Coriobacteriales bacterium]|jgi:segregation and condensation protein A|nr:segregation/condensation protein A [Coriobacteriales bacterium]
MSYRVKIESFEGPFQLLLALVSEQKVDIGAISIAEVADQYLASVEAMRELDMDVASDFLVVAATLLALKAASLLPDETLDFDDELDDLSPDEARDILVARLIAYKQFKNVAASLNARLEAEGRMHARQAGLEADFVGLLPDYLEGVTLHSLAVICADLAARREIFLLEADHIAAKPIPVEQHIEALLERLRAGRHLSFSTLLEGEGTPTLIVVNFLALLELYHRGIIDLEQEHEYGEIQIAYRDPEDWTPAVDSGIEGGAEGAEGADELDDFIKSLEQEL